MRKGNKSGDWSLKGQRASDRSRTGRRETGGLIIRTEF